MKKYFLLISLLIAHISYAQNNKQNIRGVIIDKLSQTTLPGATVQILSKTENKGTGTDEKGKYILANVSPGRYELKISYVGYKDVFVSSVVVTSGKETILDIAMEEDIKSLNEVVITANSKDKTINSLSTISGRTFSMEEVNRFAGGPKRQCLRQQLESLTGGPDIGCRKQHDTRISLDSKKFFRHSLISGTKDARVESVRNHGNRKSAEQRTLLGRTCQPSTG